MLRTSIHSWVGRPPVALNMISLIAIAAWFSTFSVTVATADSEVPSLALYVKETLPMKPGAGV